MDAALDGHDAFSAEEDEFAELVACYAAAVASYVALLDEEDDDGGRAAGSKNIKRERVPVETIFSGLGSRFIRRVCRMSEGSFWKLLRLLKPCFEKRKHREEPPQMGTSHQQPGCPWL